MTTRWLLGLGALTVLGVLGYLATCSPVGNTYLLSGQRFSLDDRIEIAHALEAKRFDARDFRFDDEGRVEVVSSRIEEAADIVTKLDVGKHSLQHYKKQASQYEPLRSAFGEGAA